MFVGSNTLLRQNQFQSLKLIMATFNMAVFKSNNFVSVHLNLSWPTEGALLEDSVLNEATIFLSPVGLLTNLIFLYVVFRVRTMRSIIYIYLVNLAVADTSFLVVSLALSSMLLSSLHPLLDNVHNILSSIHLTCRMASYCFVTVLAVDRYFAVTTPIKFRARATMSRAGKISAGLWATALAAGISHFIILNLQAQNKLANSILNIIIHATVLFVNAALYTSILKTVYPASRAPASRILGIVILNTGVFFLYNLMAIILWAVTLIYDVSDNLHLDSRTGVIDLDRCVTILYLISCSVDPIVYSVAIADRRVAFLQAFSCLDFCSCRQDNVQKPSIQNIELKVFHPLLGPGEPEESMNSARSEPDDETSSYAAEEPLPCTSQRLVHASELEPPTNHHMGSTATCPLLGQSRRTVRSPVASRGRVSATEPSITNEHSSSDEELYLKTSLPGRTNYTQVELY